MFKGNMGNQDDDKYPNEPKRGIPGGFFLFLLAAILIILTIQNLSTDRAGKVSFSHQVEHLVNLDLLHRDENRKVAQNENLVTFSGRFKERLSEEAKARYRYLELLNEQNELTEGKVRLGDELTVLQGNVSDAARTFLSLSGMPVAKNGYQVVTPFYDTKERVNSISIPQSPRVESYNYEALKTRMTQVKGSPSSAKVQELGGDIRLLLGGLQSQKLGIGSEALKEKLASISQKLGTTTGSQTISPREALASYELALAEIGSVIKELNTVKNNVRLGQLRAVRNYLVNLEQYSYLTSELSTNTSKLDKARQSVADVTWFFNNKEISTRALEKQDPESFSRWFGQAKMEWENFQTNKGLSFRAPDQPRTPVLEKTFKSQEPSPNYLSYFFTLLPVLFLLVIVYYLFSRQMKGVGSSAMNFGKSPAKMLNKSLNKVTFKDVAGVEEAKEELVEVVDFLKDPGKFTALGARIPKGVLLIGPPGTGKTLVAKAVAGEADRPFFSISGSDFVEMFVGVGASRIRDLFDQAKKSSPCIVFIDEIDAVGRHRGAGIGGGHDEREQTLNQLLVEMDGFDTNEGVILMAATNRPDVLDKALLRPGRFDRRVNLDLPDLKGRFEILKVHAKKIKMDETVDLMQLARATPGAAGADLMNVLNESALLAARKGRSCVTMVEAMEAVEKVRYGKERRSMELDENEKRNTAFHESGHAIVGLIVERGDPVEKVTIVPRGMSLGATHFVPEKNKVSYWKKELHDRLAVLMGGRIAEKLFLDDFSSGAKMDIQQATNIARAMVCEWGMSDKLGSVQYGEVVDQQEYYLPSQSERLYSDETAKIIDAEVKEILDSANTRATQILEENREKVELMSNMLLEFETLDKEDVKAIMDGSWDSENKREKQKKMEEAHRKLPPPPPSQQKPSLNDGVNIRPQQA